MNFDRLNFNLTVLCDPGPASEVPPHRKKSIASHPTPVLTDINIRLRITTYHGGLQLSMQSTANPGPLNLR